MISKDTFDKIKEIGLSILKATERLGISYNTTYKWWDKTEEDFSSFQKEHEFVLDNYRQYIIEQLKLCPQINNTLILRRLHEDFLDFDIPPATFQRYMKKLREQTGFLNLGMKKGQGIFSLTYNSFRISPITMIPHSCYELNSSQRLTVGQKLIIQAILFSFYQTLLE